MNILLKHGADPNAVGYCSQYSKYCDRDYNRKNDKVSPLMLITFNGSTSNTECLLNAGANVNQTNSIGQTASHIYCISIFHQDHYGSMLNVLIKHGADVNLQDANGRTALHYACEKQNIEIVELLLEVGAQTIVVDNGGFTELHMAAHSNYDADLKVKCLLESHSYPAKIIIEAYETLAWFLLGEHDAHQGKLDKVMDCMTKATKMREEYNLPKTVCDLPEYYGFVKEW